MFGSFLKKEKPKRGDGDYNAGDVKYCKGIDIVELLRNEDSYFLGD